MIFSTIKTITIPEGAVKKITVGGDVLWEEPASFKNWVFYSTESDGKTIYNNGKGYKDGCRIRSGGAEAEYSYASITGYIPYVKGDKLYICPPFTGGNTDNTINFYDNTFACLGQVTDSGNYYGFCNSSFKTKVVNGISVLDISAVTVTGVENIAYVRIGNNIGNGIISSGSEMIITKNEEIK
jgi:hypothetical protein